MDYKTLTDTILEQLRLQGVDLEAITCGCEGAKDKLKVVAVAADLRDSLHELGQTPRDKVLMVRVDLEVLNQLDAWVEAGAARSRSEAGALFLKEGLKVRARELGELSDALDKVELAKKSLRDKARQLLGSFGAEREKAD